MGPREGPPVPPLAFSGVKHVIPMHYATFPMLNRHTPKRCVAETKGIADLTVHALNPGESLGLRS